MAKWGASGPFKGTLFHLGYRKGTPLLANTQILNHALRNHACEHYTQDGLSRPYFIINLFKGLAKGLQGIMAHPGRCNIFQAALGTRRNVVLRPEPVESWYLGFRFSSRPEPEDVKTLNPEALRP